MFAVAVDRDAAQITLEGPPAGPGGGAALIPVPGVELVFDRADGRLSQVVIEAVELGGPMIPGEPAIAYLGRVLGNRVATAVRQASYGTVMPVVPHTQSTVIAALSRLARLNSARRTSPVPWSPLWKSEAAELAREAGWTERASACQRVSAVAAAGSGCPGGELILPVGRSLSGWLDPGLIPAGVFRYGLSPATDLDIRLPRDQPLVTVEAMLAPGARCSELARCRVRLVDSAARRVLAVSPLRVEGLRARAELSAPAGPGTLWLEVVDDGRRPVRGTRLRRMRRALRWADAALRAASRPAALAPGRAEEQWARLAELAWDSCCADWLAAGDADRAAAAARLARLPVRWTRPYLAEATCKPAAGR